MTGPILTRARRFRARYQTLSGWRLYSVLFALGALGVLGHAPVFFFPAFMLAISALVMTLDDARLTGRSYRAGFLRGWSFGAGYFLAGTSWVANAFLVSAGDHAWLIWAPLIVLPAGLGLFWGAAGAVYARWAPRHSGRIGVFVMIWMAAEVTRSTILSGFPWNLPGHVFPAGAPVSQTAALYGVYGVSILALCLAAAPAALSGSRRSVSRLIPLAVGLVFLAVSWGYGVHRLNQTEITRTDHTLRLVRIDLPQREKRYRNRHAILDEYLELSLQDDLDGIDAVIWPEGAIPGFLLDDRDLMEQITTVFPEGSRLITGVARAEFGPDSPPHPTAYFNSLVSLIFLDGAPQLEARYDKARLVPFGESNPLRSLTRWVGFETLGESAPAYDPGSGSRTLVLNGLPGLAPLICYEAIYPRYIPRHSDRAGWMLNISNDAWYGNSSGPQQLLNQTQYRTIEEGMPLVRVAAAGVSGQIDPLGRLTQTLSSGSAEPLTVRLLKATDAPPYAIYGDAIWLIVLVILVGGTLFPLRFRR